MRMVLEMYGRKVVPTAVEMGGTCINILKSDISLPSIP
jgi:hypothetical protein